MLNPREQPRPTDGIAVLAILAAVVVLDYVTGYELNFFVFYFLPVALAAWRAGLMPGLAAAVLCAVVWYEADFLAGHVQSSAGVAVWNTIVRLTAFLVIGWATSRIRDLLLTEQKISEELSHTLAEVRVLEGMLPICASCKKIRDDHEQWQPLESYLSDHSRASFSHGLCPDCAQRARQEAGLTGRRPEG
jgi:K+-sensing histidine kinase KdpD